jgi:hypothetical protein
VVCALHAGETVRVKEGQWIIEQPSDNCEAAQSAISRT